METYLQRLLGNDYMVYTGDLNSSYINIETSLLDSHNDRIEIYYFPKSSTLSDNECYDFDFSVFNADWHKTDYVMALLKVNCISISESGELFKIVKGELKTEIENFTKVIQEISNYIVSELPIWTINLV